jgi:uncharacterized C2H2 Zn-finger protein
VSRASSIVEERTLLAGTVHTVQIRAKTFFIQPDPSYSCSLPYVLCRLKHVRNDNVKARNLSGRKVVSFRLGEGEAADTLEAFDVVLDEDIDQEDDEELLFQAEQTDVADEPAEDDRDEDRRAEEDIDHAEKTQEQEIEDRAEVPYDHSLQLQQYQQYQGHQLPSATVMAAYPVWRVGQFLYVSVHPSLVPSVYDQSVFFQGHSYLPPMTSLVFPLQPQSRAEAVDKTEEKEEATTEEHHSEVDEDGAESEVDEDDLEEAHAAISRQTTEQTADKEQRIFNPEVQPEIALPAFEQAFGVVTLETVTQRIDDLNLLESHNAFATASGCSGKREVTTTAAPCDEIEQGYVITASTILAMRTFVLRPPELEHLYLQRKRMACRTGVYCLVCARIFHNEKQLRQHEAGKAHAEALAAGNARQTGKQSADEEESVLNAEGDTEPDIVLLAHTSEVAMVDSSCVNAAQTTIDHVFEPPPIIAASTILAWRTFTPRPPELANLKKGFPCPRCNAVLNSLKQLEDHINGKAHNEASAKVGSTDGWQVSSKCERSNLKAQVRTRPEAIAEDPELNLVTPAQDTTGTVSAVTDMLHSNDPWANALVAPRVASTFKPPPGLEHLRASRSAVQCPRCDKIMHNEKQLQEHLAGKAHASAGNGQTNEQTAHVEQRILNPAVQPASDVLSFETVILRPEDLDPEVQTRLGADHAPDSVTLAQDSTGSSSPVADGTDVLCSNDPWANALVGPKLVWKRKLPPGLERVQIPTSSKHPGHSASDASAEGVSRPIIHSTGEAPLESFADQQHSGSWNFEALQRRCYFSDEWDPYHSSRVVDSAHFMDQRFLSDDSPDSRHYCVLKAGNFNDFADVSESALDEIKARSEHIRSGDNWTRKSLRKYLRYRWIRLLEQGRVLHIFASARKSPTYQRMFEQGYSQHVVLFHTGLVDAKGEPIFAVLVQDPNNKGRYKLFRSGVHTMVNGKLPEWWCGLLQSQDLHVNCPSSKHLTVIDSLMNASYFQSRDQRLLFDPALKVELNSHHIVEQNLHRLIMGGVDVDEASFRDRAETDLPDESNWRFLCHKGKKIRELKYDQYYNSFRFSRGNLGKKSVEMLVKQWQQASVQATSYNFSLAVPHFYYKLVPLPNDVRRQVYVGRLQLLLPLFCDGSTPKLALSIQYEDGPSPYYFSATVLTISLANSNARQIATPQVPWIRAPADEEDDDEV